jgi:hypothetical protein
MMKRKNVIPICAVTAACAFGALPAGASAATDVQQASSENWSGYVAGSAQGSSQQFKSVSGSWVAPTATCTSGQTYSAFWVGLGGSGESEALEQAGTEADCSAGGSAGYFAWYELVPSAPVRIGMTVTPGDRMSSRVTVTGSEVTLSVSDQTTGASFTKTVSMSDPDTSSAEWIAEAPSSCDQTASACSPLPLTDFGTVTFTSATATTTGGHTGTISDSDWSAAAVSLSPSSGDAGYGGPQFSSQEGSAGATPGALSSDGSSFAVAYAADTSQVSTSTGAGNGSGFAGGYGGYGGDAGYGGYGGGYGGYGGYGGGYGGYSGYAYVPSGYILAY